MEQNIELYSDNTVPLDADTAAARLANIFDHTMTKEEFEAAIIHDYCAVQSGELYFDTSEQAKTSVEHIESWADTLAESALTSQTDKENQLMQIQNVQYHERFKAVTFVAFSETESAIREQLLAFLEFCKTLDGFNKFDAPILQTIKPIVWNR